MDGIGVIDDMDALDYVEVSGSVVELLNVDNKVGMMIKHYIFILKYF